jgi:hypothetical protein
VAVVDATGAKRGIGITTHRHVGHSVSKNITARETAEAAISDENASIIPIGHSALMKLGIASMGYDNSRKCTSVDDAVFKNSFA